MTCVFVQTFGQVNRPWR